jgi:5-methylcytosine-specific restriction protein B
MKGTFIGAAIQILTEKGEGVQMHYREITRIARERNLIGSSGITPEQTMNSKLNHAIKNQGENQFPRIVGHKVGLYSIVLGGATRPKVGDVPVSLGYSITSIVEDGCFLSEEFLISILNKLEVKKNIILQGPPGTGKTWLAKRLAFALIRQRDDSKVRAVQFHPNLSYEDFIRGWRPMGDGKLSLVDGPFMEMINTAMRDSGSTYVVVIEEVNRGNPSQIFGEMLTLLEADKRTPDEALELSYRQFDDERVFIPKNLYVIGTMNVADRSLALVDLALRRRFAFIDLQPVLGEPWRNWLQSRYGFDTQTLDRIESNITALNEMISADSGLGPQYRVGHSYVTPTGYNGIKDPSAWFCQVVETEIGPLLDEYWFDSPATSKKAKERLLEGF